MEQSKLKVYYRLTKPGIIYGNAMTTIAGFLFAAKGHINFLLLLEAVIGSSLIIACGCVFNNYLDRNIDKKMKRTKERALVTGIVSAKNALTFGTVLGLLGFTLIIAKVNLLTAVIGAVGLVDYVVLYGYTKRRSIFSTLVGSIAGATPIIAGYCAFTNRFDLGAIILFTIMAVWQMPHFYSIAIYRIEEYKKAGIPLWSILRGIYSTKIQILGFLCLYLAVSVLLYSQGYAGVSYLVVMLGLSLWWLYRAVKGFKTQDSNKWARMLFGTSLIVLMGFSLMLSINNFLP